jgi:hypothetical protein
MFHDMIRTSLLIRVLENTREQMVHYKYMHMRGDTIMTTTLQGRPQGRAPTIYDYIAL